MLRNALWFVSGALVALVGSFLLDLRQETAKPLPRDLALEQSLDDLAQAIRDAGSRCRRRRP